MTSCVPTRADQKRIEADRGEAALAMQILNAAGIAADQAGQSPQRETVAAAAAPAPAPARFNQDQPPVAFSEGVADERYRVCNMLRMNNVSAQFETIKVLASLGVPGNVCFDALAHARSTDATSDLEIGRRHERQRIMGILNQPGAGANLDLLARQINSGAPVATAQQTRATIPVQPAQTAQTADADADALAKSILASFALLENN